MGEILEQSYTKGTISKTADIPIDPTGQRFDIEISCDKWPSKSVGTILVKGSFGGQEVVLQQFNVTGGTKDPKTGKPFTSVKCRGDFPSFTNEETRETIILQPDKIWIELNLKEDIQSKITYDTSKLK